ncbi:glycosyltransferase family 2 protein [uncultured Bacteroides sp.]|uniref:glycosyltransferase family 2 protein n=1 Tax=uncultured Bacteroides sp. TaxID=162156 RepID=UPI002AAAF401|nr:glycosyltransferase family 2 protein [uncultured Bacteroides sp.]
MDISIIIVNYKTYRLTSDCVKSIYKKSNNVSFEVIIIDNNSDEYELNLLPSKYPNLRLVLLNENIGFGRANNFGAKLAIGKYLFFLNSDTYFLNNALKYYFDFFQINCDKLKIGVLGSILKDESLDETGSFGPLPQPIKFLLFSLGFYNKNTKISRRQMKSLCNNSYFEVGYVTGANMFILKDTFNLVEGFDENIFMYYEESDLQFRLKMNSYNNYIIKGPEIVHLEGKSFSAGIINNNKRLMIEKSRFYYFNKNSNIFIYVLFRIIYLFIRVITILDFRYSLKDRKEYLKMLLKFK